MKKIINGKRYDTDTATCVAEASSSFAVNDFHWWKETLYRKSTGEYFLHGEGGPSSKYAKPVDLRGWTSGERIMPMTYSEAQEWAEENLDGDEYEAIFGEVDESDENQTVTFSLPVSVVDKISKLATINNTTKSDVVSTAVMVWWNESEKK